ncbi:MAG: hypothetical protein M3O15_01890 [Acidobacteriota bacterium]|nr:hypothetical protein [Acidobacteriota bacterium]
MPAAPNTPAEIELPVGPEAALAAVARTAEAWGAELRSDGGGGHRLFLPVVTGIRRGLLAGPLTAEPAAAGSRVLFRPDEATYYLQTAAVALLLLAALGAAVCIAWPLFPSLIAAAPLGAVLALGGWFLVVSRLRSSGPEEFLEMVAALAAGEDDGIPAGEEPAAAEGTDEDGR